MKQKKRRKRSPVSTMKFEGGGDFKIRLTGQKLEQVKLTPEWIISEIKETEQMVDTEGNPVKDYFISKTTRTSTVRLYVDGKSIGEEKEMVNAL